MQAFEALAGRLGKLGRQVLPRHAGTKVDITK